jgi:D-sedoheptulose 7-phosphate isomerase
MNLNQLQEKVSEISEEQKSKLLELVQNASQVILIGNGGSNSIASHIAVDYVKFLNKKSFAFTDPTMLTAFANDYSVSDSYRKYLEFMTMDTPGSFVILISSSGNSKNIYNAAQYCQTMGVDFAILTGFNEDNIVRSFCKEAAALEYWVDSNSYGVVECVHQIFLHSIINN